MPRLTGSPARPRPRRDAADQRVRCGVGRLRRGQGTAEPVRRL